jgi:glycosyltransferase involved in cell wall biosynthesis
MASNAQTSWMKSLLHAGRDLISSWRGIDPHEREQFNAVEYLKENPDVARAGVDPYLHFAKHGRVERRAGTPPLAPSPAAMPNKAPQTDSGSSRSRSDTLDNEAAFDAAFYLEKYPDIARAGIDPYLHYVNHGKGEGRIGAAPRLEWSGSLANLDPSRETVLIVSHEASRTGAPILSLNIARELKKEHNVVSLMLRGGALVEDFADAADVVVCPPPDGRKQDFVLSYVVDRLLSSCSFRYAIVNSIESRLVLPWLARHFLPTITLIHEFAAYTRPKGAVDDAIFWSSNAVFSADIVRDNAVAQCPDLATRKPVVLPQGRCAVPVRHETPMAASEEKARIARAFRPDGWPKETVVVMGAGYVQMRKGVDLFLDCAAHLLRSKQGKPWRFVWIGHGYDPDADIGYSVYLADQIRRAGLEGSFCFLEELTDIEAAYEQADIFMVSARLDPLPNVAIDAITKGLPLLCFDKTTGIADVLKRHGLERECVVPYLDSGAMAQRVRKLIESKEHRRSVGKRLKKVANDLFDMSKYVQKLDALARETAARSLQEKEDFQELANTKLLRRDFFVNDHLKDKQPDEAARAFLRGWATNIQRRKPFPGFHPGVYQERHGLALQGRNPFLDYLAAGKPQGPWTIEVISPEKPKGRSLPNRRIALHLHVYYPDLADEVRQRLNGNNVHPDLFVSVPSKDARQKTERVLAGYSGRVVDIQIVPNRGRDIGPLFTTFGKRLTDSYDIIGHLHTKKTADVKDAAMGKTWYRFLLENLLGGQTKMADVIVGRMMTDPSLGLVFPDDPYVVGWSSNREHAQMLANRLRLGRLPYENINFPVGTMFWARSAALKPWVRLKLGWDDYPPEPLPYDGSVLHAVERLLPTVTEHAGLRLAVTNVPGITR